MKVVYHLFVGILLLEVALGFETQRQWSDNAIERTSPCLLALFSLVVLIAIKLHPQNLPIRRAS